MKAGDVVRVRVVDVDINRKRIGLTMRKHDDGGAGRPERQADRTTQRTAAPKPQERNAPPGRGSPQGALGAALAEALKRK